MSIKGIIKGHIFNFIKAICDRDLDAWMRKNRILRVIYGLLNDCLDYSDKINFLFR